MTNNLGMGLAYVSEIAKYSDTVVVVGLAM